MPNAFHPINACFGKLSRESRARTGVGRFRRGEGVTDSYQTVSIFEGCHPNEGNGQRGFETQHLCAARHCADGFFPGNSIGSQAAAGNDLAFWRANWWNYLFSRLCSD